MDEYISKEAVLKAFRITAKNSNKDYQRGLQDAIDCLVPEVIADIPTADVQPVKHGRWIEKPTVAYCSCCHVHWTKSFITSLRKTYKFCPNCGARMDGD